MAIHGDRQPRVLLVNPWIHDFAAFDFWARPLGLLVLGAVLEKAGAPVRLLDLTDPVSPFLPEAAKPRRSRPGAGKFAAQRIPQPAPLPHIERHYRRYGLPPEAADAAAAEFEVPDAVFVTSMMTYWYPGVAETISWIKRTWPGVPVVLGGVYATLLPEHAARSTGADVVATGGIEQCWNQVTDITGISYDIGSETPPAAHHLNPTADSAPLITSRGCPFDCPYCGVKVICRDFVAYDPQRVEEEVRQIVLDLGIHDIGIVDDAFLFNTSRALDILDRIASLETPVRLHAVSGLSCRGLTPEVARGMKKAGFATLRVGLETSDAARQSDWGGKVTTDEFEGAIAALREAGFAANQIGVYVLAGAPGQTRQEIETSVDTVLARGVRPHLAEYSPVPGSQWFEAAQRSSPYDLAEPLFHNPTLMPCGGEEITQAVMWEIKNRINQQVAR
ncbi:MAG: B12-binding domain-containing radical SAM protein [Candidatus Lernaella stagnicola]|nr:B12-binding domain-containing radical SAM protein [Candidatus Lernaella stagnicola]